MKLNHSKELAVRRRLRVRNKISGVAARPRLTVRFSHKHIYAQVIDDRAGRTLAAATSMAKDVRDTKLKPNLAGAKILGERLASAAQKAGVSAVVFDRGGRRYHGCVKTFADAARAGGLKF
jgi:large subunit ribosomal protein L18